MNRQEILETAASVVMSDRNVEYGEPEDNFAIIAGLWSTYLNARTGPSIPTLTIMPHDVAVFLTLLKVARVVTSPQKSDHWIDIAGYAACGGEIVTKTQAHEKGRGS